MKEYYELHVTMESIVHPQVIKKAVEEIGWKFSSIAGDPVLGDGVKTYGTKHFNANKHSHGEMVEEVDRAAASIQRRGINVVRKKVELVVYDAIQGRDF